MNENTWFKNELIKIHNLNGFGVVGNRWVSSTEKLTKKTYRVIRDYIIDLNKKNDTNKGRQ